MAHLGITKNKKACRTADTASFTGLLPPGTDTILSKSWSWWVQVSVPEEQDENVRKKCFLSVNTPSIFKKIS